MQSAFLRLNSRDFINGLVMTVGGALATALLQWFNAPGFDYATFDSALMLKVAIGAGMAYFAKNLFTTKDGAFMGVLGRR
jgi:hypothetical protein